LAFQEWKQCKAARERKALLRNYASEFTTNLCMKQLKATFVAWKLETAEARQQIQEVSTTACWVLQHIQVLIGTCG